MPADSSYWCSGCIYFTPSVLPDHSRWCSSPTVTQPHLLHLAWSLMQNEALTLYQSVNALSAIAPISSSLWPACVCTRFVPWCSRFPENTSVPDCKYKQMTWFYQADMDFVSLPWRGDHRAEQRSRVVTVRVVSAGGRCTAGEIDSYLDENEGWCLWGERRAAFASKWTQVLQRRSSITDNKNIKSSKAAGRLFTFSNVPYWCW